ncbi:hypothetical protein [Paludisphaera mucosa]|uniref:Uncharacterized protein n=1 Tax=Paludisphaera mucosa TaxID=3030827 RepID=A0ABT6FBW4_9BACT|nr:hypothetical protein [Paludisphaera mucosa]MDG3005052.1 hypothetical protein [Paludisphaera mucosa]
MPHSRRSVLSALGAALPFGLGESVRAGADALKAPADAAPTLRFRPFEDAVREAFAGPGDGRGSTCRRVEIGCSEQVQAGVQGCCNDRPFAGFPAGRLRIVRSGFEPGPVRGGVRLYVATLDVVRTDGRPADGPGRPLDFASLPPAPILA